MRALVTACSLASLSLLAACAVRSNDAGDRASAASDALSPTSAASFVTLTTPRCGRGPCAAYQTHEVDGTAVHDVGNLDFSGTSFTKSQIADLSSAPDGGVVLRGALGPMQQKTHLPSFVVLDAYRGAAGVAYDAAARFYQGGDYDATQRCLGAPDHEGSVAELNTTITGTYDAIDVSAVASDAAAQALLRAEVVSQGAIVAGRLVAGPATGSATLVASQIFARVAPPAVATPVKRLTVDGTALLDPSRQPIQLRGWNWGQWGTYQSCDEVANRVTEKANVVRVILRWWGQYGEASTDARDPNAPSTGFIDEGHLAALDQMVLAAASQGLWVDLVVDSDCGQRSFDTDAASVCGTVNGKPNGQVRDFSNSPDMAEQFSSMWEFLARRYESQDYVGMYELLPEPHLGCKAAKKCDDYSLAPAFYAPLIQRVRAIDAVTPILVGPNGDYDVTQIETSYIEIGGEKPYGLVYTGDLLENAASHTEYVTDYAVAFSQRHGVPVFIQQVGVRNDDTEDAGGPSAAARRDAILTALDGAGIGWTWWTYREKASGGTGYAPYWQSSGAWQSNAQWLEGITSHF